MKLLAVRAIRRGLATATSAAAPSTSRPAASRQYGEVLFNEKLRKCTSLQQVSALVDAQQQQQQSSILSPQRCIRVLNELSRFPASNNADAANQVLQKLFAAAKTHKYSTAETIQFCQALAELKTEVPSPPFLIANINAMDLSDFTSQTALESLRTLESLPDVKNLAKVRALAAIAVDDLEGLSVPQLCAMAKYLSPQQVVLALQKRDFTDLALEDCWEILAMKDDVLFAKLTREAIQTAVQGYTTPRLARALWQAGSPQKLVEMKREEDKLAAAAAWEEDKLKALQSSLERFKQRDDEILKRISQSEPDLVNLPAYLVDLMWDLAQMNFESKPAFELAASISLEFESPACDLAVLDKDRLLKLLFALAKFKVRNRAVLERLQTELVDRKRLDEFAQTPRDMILLVWHMVKLGSPSSTFMDMASARLAGMDLTSLSQRDVSLLLYSFSRLNYRASPELMERLCAYLQTPSLYVEQSAYHLLNLLDYLARINYNSPEARKLYQWFVSTLKTMPDVSELSERDLATLFRIMAQLKIQDQDFTDRLVGGMLKRTGELESKNASHLIHLLRDISQLQHSSKADAIMTEIVKHLKQENSLVELPSKELAVLLQSFSKWGFYRDEEILRNITRELLTRGDDLFKGDLRHLSSILLNFGALWVRSGSAGEELLAVTADELMSRETLSNVETATLTRLLSSFDKFGYRNQDLLARIADELLRRDFSQFTASSLHQIAKCYSKLKMRNIALFDGIKSELLERKDLSHFSKQALCEIAAAIAMLGLTKDCNRLFHKLAAQFQQADLLQLRPKLVSDLCFAFAQTRASDEALFSLLANCLVERNDLELFSLQRLAVVLWSYAELRHTEKNRHLFEFISRHLQDRADFKEIVMEDLVSILGSFANAMIPDRALFHAASEVLQERDLSKLRERELAALVHSFGKVKHKDETLFARLLQEVSTRKIEAFTPTAQVQLLRGFEAFGMAKGAWMEALALDLKRQRERGMVQQQQQHPGKGGL